MIVNRKTLVPVVMVVLILAGISSSALVVFAQDTGSAQDATTCAAEDADNVQHEAENEQDDANEVQCAEDDANTSEESDSTDCTVADADNVQDELDSENSDSADTEEADNAETDNEEAEVEDASDDNSQVDATDQENDSEAADCGEEDNLQEPAYTGSIVVDDSTSYASDSEEATALASMATISADEAQAIVEADTGATVVKVELENENGFLVYGVTLEDGTVVKVDAGNGSILFTESAENTAE